MMRRFDHQGVTWVDLESPTPEEIQEISEEFNIGPMLAHELVTPTEKPRVDIYPDSVYAVFHFPSLRHTGAAAETEEIDVVLGKTYLVTAHYRPVEAIDDFARSFEVAELLGRGQKVSSGYLLFELGERLYRESEGELDAIEQTVADIEHAIFSGHEREMVTVISKTSRELILNKRILGNHTDTLEALTAASVELFGNDMKNYFHAVAALHYRAHARAVALSEIVTELRETNMALLSTRQNDIMKSLTIIASIFLPLSLIATIFGMNTTSTPILGRPHDFLLIILGMLIVAAIFVLYFRIKKWF